jgi:hypothetical protein
MSESLDIHPASTSERVALYTNTFEFWAAPGATLQEHVAERMNSPQHNRGRWYAGCLEGRPVCGLGAYPMEFLLRGRVVPGIAIGSVHTVPRCRRRGYAGELLEWVENVEISRGAALSLLYSNIEPAYYAKFGYELCDNYSGRLDIGSADKILDEAPDQPRLRYVSVRPESRRAEIESLYAAYQAQFPVSISRDPLYWDYVFRKGAADEFAMLQDAEGATRGYAQLAVGQGSVNIVDWAAVDHSDQTARDLFLAVLREGRERGWNSVGGWLPDTDATRSLFPIRARTSELTMLKPLRSEINLGNEVLRAAQHFREIDHV